MDKLKGAKYFSKMDVQWGYNNIQIRQGDEWKAAFKMNKGLFELTVMFFGMCNSPATFQSMMDMTFEDIEQGCTVIYMDDIMNFSNNLDTLEKLDKNVLRQLQENDLYLKPTKCEFKKTKIEYLGMVIITEGKITMDSVKVKGIRDWPAPTTVKEVRSFLGFGNFYRKFINKFSELAAPLNGLLKKDKIFIRGHSSKLSFPNTHTPSHTPSHTLSVTSSSTL